MVEIGVTRGAENVRTGSFLTALLLWISLGTTGCRGPDVRPDLSRAGFRTPEQTFTTWRAAFLADLYLLEFNCLSSGFRRENGISILAYAEAREILLDEQPFLRFGLSHSEIEEITYEGPNRARIVVLSKSLFHEIRFAVDLTREGVYELWIGDERAQDDYLQSLADAFQIREHEGRQYAQAWVVLEAEEFSSNPERLEEITEMRVALEWKIDALLQLDSETESPPEGD